MNPLSKLSPKGQEQFIFGSKFIFWWSVLWIGLFALAGLWWSIVVYSAITIVLRVLEYRRLRKRYPAIPVSIQPTPFDAAEYWKKPYKK